KSHSTPRAIHIAFGRVVVVSIHIEDHDMKYALTFAFALSAALFLFQGDDARNTMTKVQHDRCASFEAAGVEC
ncbi:hypothetical protein L4P85_006324, partial [Pseudomonas aeruginosa]